VAGPLAFHGKPTLPGGRLICALLQLPDYDLEVGQIAVRVLQDCVVVYVLKEALTGIFHTDDGNMGNLRNPAGSLLLLQVESGPNQRKVVVDS